MRAGRKKSLIGSEKTTYLMRSFYLESKVIEMCYNIYERDECYE